MLKLVGFSNLLPTISKVKRKVFCCPFVTHQDYQYVWDSNSSFGQIVTCKQSVSCEVLVPGKVSEPVSEKIGTEKSLGTGIGKIWYRKKVSEPVSEKFDTGTDFRRQNLEILKICNGYRYRIGISIGNFSSFLVVSELVPEKIGTGKKSQNGYR